MRTDDLTTLGSAEFQTSLPRWRTTDAASKEAVANKRSAGSIRRTGNADGLGGWTYVNRLSLKRLQATGMGLVGLYGSTAALATTPTLATVVTCIGIGFQRGIHATPQTFRATVPPRGSHP